MKLLTAFLLVLFANLSSTDETSLQVIRVLFASAERDINASQQLLEKLSDVNKNSTAVLLGYKGAAYMMQAKHLLNPYSKWKSFSKGKRILEGAIANNNDNVELRYLRLIIQMNVPSFLGYNANIIEDKIFLHDELKVITDQNLRQNIIALLNTSH